MCNIETVWDAATLSREFQKYKDQYPDAAINKFSNVAGAGYELQKVTQKLGGLPSAYTRPERLLFIRWKRIQMLHVQAWLKHCGIPPGKPSPAILNGFKIRYRYAPFGFDSMTQVA